LNDISQHPDLISADAYVTVHALDTGMVTLQVNDSIVEGTWMEAVDVAYSLMAAAHKAAEDAGVPRLIMARYLEKKRREQ